MSAPVIVGIIHPLSVKPGALRQRFRLDVGGEVLVAASANPGREACRLLLARGTLGTLETRWHGSSVTAMRYDIERAAKWIVTEGAPGLAYARWRENTAWDREDGQDDEVATTLPAYPEIGRSDRDDMTGNGMSGEEDRS